MSTNPPLTVDTEPATQPPSELLAITAAGVVDPIELVDESHVELVAPTLPATEATEPPPAEATPAAAVPSPIDPLPPLRQKLLDRIERSARLPRGLRQRLLDAVPATVVSDSHSLLLPADAIVDAVEAWAPLALQFDGQDLHGVEHPAGDVFFSGDAEQVSDAQAERIARRQLERSGYLPRDAR